MSPKRSLQSLPIWSCSVWGLPCVPAYAETGALLPHLFTLTPGGLHGPLARPSDRRRYIFCCTGRLCALRRKSRTLSGTLPCGVRTFLPRSTANRERQRSSGRLLYQCSSQRVSELAGQRVSGWGRVGSGMRRSGASTGDASVWGIAAAAGPGPSLANLRLNSLSA